MEKLERFNIEDISGEIELSRCNYSIQMDMDNLEEYYISIDEIPAKVAEMFKEDNKYLKLMKEAIIFKFDEEEQRQELIQLVIDIYPELFI